VHPAVVDYQEVVDPHMRTIFADGREGVLPLGLYFDNSLPYGCKKVPREIWGNQLEVLDSPEINGLRSAPSVRLPGRQVRVAVHTLLHVEEASLETCSQA